MVEAMRQSEVVTDHPAKFSDAILQRLQHLLDDEAMGGVIEVLDPFAGVGRIHELAKRGHVHTTGVELEPEWANNHPDTIVGDATNLPEEWAEHFDAVCTSPSYGNRLADAYDGRDGSKRMTYRLSLGRPLTSGSGSAMQWGAEYRGMHTRAMREMVRVLKPHGLLVVNMSSHYRNKRYAPVAEWWAEQLFTHQDLTMVRVDPIRTPRMGFGANGSARVPFEHLIVARKLGS